MKIKLKATEASSTEGTSRQENTSCGVVNDCVFS